MEEERRQTLTIFPETVLAPLIGATGVKVGRAEAFHLIWGVDQEPFKILWTISKEQAPGNVYSISGAPQPWVKDLCLRGKGTGCQIFSRTHSHSFNQLSLKDRL